MPRMLERLLAGKALGKCEDFPPLAQNLHFSQKKGPPSWGPWSFSYCWEGLFLRRVRQGESIPSVIIFLRRLLSFFARAVMS